MSHRRFGLGRTLLLIVFIGAAATMTARAFIPHAEPARLFDKETKLKVHDRKIVSVGEEFMRRSSKLRDVIKELAACNPRCPTELTVKFDRTVQAEWPRIAERLLVYKDWDQGQLRAREPLETIVERYGKDGVISRCHPMLTVTAGRGITPFATFEKFVCNSSPAQHHARG